MSEFRDVYSRITDRIIADLEQGVRPWRGSGSSGTESSIQPSSPLILGSRSGLSSPRATVSGSVKA
jgi:antirestriction protein ArdC